VFDIALADRFFRFAEKLKHYRGEWAGSLIVLQPYQKFRLGSIFAWVHQDTGYRRFRHSFNLLPRKQGKSLEAAIVSLYVTFYSGEPGALGVCAATKRDQAKLVFGDAKKLVESSGLKSRIVVQVASLSRDDTSSKLVPLGADADSTDGLNPNFVNIDEYQAHKTRALIDVLETATGSRRQPLHFKIGTAGDDPVSPCGDEFDYACKILEGVLVDENYFAFIASADPTDDWQDEATWIKANPNWNISIKPDDMRSLATKAKGIPSAAATFKQKRLCLWTNASNPCLSVEGWKRGQNPNRLTREAWLAELEHEPVFVGIDLASKIDLCCCSLVFPPGLGRGSWRIIQHIWTPADTLADRAHRDRAPYLVWEQAGWLKTNPGTMIDHELIRAVLIDARQRYSLMRVGFDPWHADALISRIVAEDGFTEEQVLAVPQTYGGMSSACLKVQAEILSGAMDARGCPVTAWSVSNVVANHDGKDNLMFAKGKSRGRIDPVIAATIAVALKLREPVVVAPSYSMFVFGGTR
jgi:phage terminase large subunit-like protein